MLFDKKTGTASNVNNVANARPLIIQTAISLKNASAKSGDIPAMVVPAARITGRNLLILASIIKATAPKIID